MGTGLVIIPSVFVCCPCHGVNQCRSHTAALQSKIAAGCRPLCVGWACFGLSFKPWPPARLSLSHGSLSLKKGQISLQAPLRWLSLISAVKSALPLLFKGQHISSVPLPTSATVSSLCLGYTGPSTEKSADHRSPDALCTALFPWIHELYCKRHTEDQGRGLALNPKDLF